MTLNIQTVMQPQGPELVPSQLARKEATRLISELGDALFYKLLIDFVINIHGKLPSDGMVVTTRLRAASSVDAPAYRWPSFTAIASLDRPPTRAWIRPPVDMTRANRISWGRGASWMPTSIDDK